MWFFALVILVLPFVSSEIFVGQPEALYNFGDELKINVTLFESSRTVGFLSGFLVCNDKDFEIYKSIYTVNANEQKSLVIETIIDPFIIGKLSGECYIRISYAGNLEESQKFEISRGVNINVAIEKGVVGPGDKVKISGRAVKRNGNLLDGFVEVFVELINISIVNKVDKGNFEAYFVIPENAIPGNYNVDVRAYENDLNGLAMNEGKASGVIKIKQVIKDIEIVLEQNSVFPGNEFKYNVLLYDQAGGRADGDVKIIIYEPSKKIFLQKLINSGAGDSLVIGINYTPDDWSIIASYNELEDSRQFLVERLEKLSYNLENGILTVKNIGNVEYKKPVEISIGDVKEVEDIDLDIGESKQLKLTAPDGDYNIEINDGENPELLNGFLTGRVIGVNEVGSYLFGDSGIWIWIALIVLLLIITLTLWLRIRKKNYVEKVPQLGGMWSLRKVSPATINVTPQQAKTEMGIVDKGARQEASIVALKIKNLPSLQSAVNYQYNPLEAIDNALLKVKSAGAKIYVDKDYRIIIFVPMVTKEKDNEMRAINSGKEIENILEGYNKTSPQIINFGIGVHVGEMAVELTDDKLKFASLGNTVITAKRMAEHAKKELLISEQMHKRTLGKIKVEKLPDKSYWLVKQLISRENYEEFIEKFLNRQRKEKGIHYSSDSNLKKV